MPLGRPGNWILCDNKMHSKKSEQAASRNKSIQTTVGTRQTSFHGDEIICQPLMQEWYLFITNSVIYTIIFLFNSGQEEGKWRPRSLVLLGMYWYVKKSGSNTRIHFLTHLYTPIHTPAADKVYAGALRSEPAFFCPFMHSKLSDLVCPWGLPLVLLTVSGENNNNENNGCGNRPGRIISWKKPNMAIRSIVPVAKLTCYRLSPVYYTWGKQLSANG